MKKNFNLKLTAFLVSLFIGIVVVILGSKFDVCLGIGFVVLGLSLPLYVWYDTEAVEKALSEISQLIEEIEEKPIEENPENIYSLQELYITQTKLIRRKKRVSFMFYACGVLFVIIGFASFI